jgi:protein translocase SecG subunit
VAIGLFFLAKIVCMVIFTAAMESFFISLLTFILVCASIFVVLVILMQKPSANAGMGSSLGGGAAESAFGSDTTKVLTKWTVSGVVIFFTVAFALSMLHIGVNCRAKRDPGINLETIIDGVESSDK